MTKTYSITKYKYVKERYGFQIEADSEEEALEKAKQYYEDKEADFEDSEDMALPDEYEIEEL